MMTEGTGMIPVQPGSMVKYRYKQADFKRRFFDPAVHGQELLK